MQRVRSAAILVPTLFALSAACYSPKVNEPGKEEDPFKGTSMDPNAGPINDAPPPKNAKEPDMDFIKDMARRSGEAAEKCIIEPANTGPRGEARVQVTFEPTGQSSDIIVMPPHEGTPIGDCIKRAFVGVFVTSWEGEAVKVDQTVDLSGKKKKTDDEKKSE